MDSRDRDIIIEFKGRLSDDILTHLKKIIIFGSRVKGNSAEDSDLDVIALVDEKNSNLEKKLEDIAYQVMWEHDFKPIISLKVFAEGQFYNAVQSGFAFYQHVEKEGIVL